MTDTPALTPVDERTIDFYGDAIVAFSLEVTGEREIYVPLRPLCDYLGLSWNAQRERIRRDPVLDEALRFARVTRANSAGGDPNVLCLPLEYLPGWLFGISTSRVRPELQDKILRYRRECFRVLWRAFQSETLATIAPVDRTTSSSTGLAHIRELGLAIAQMAEQQLALEQRVDTHAERLDKAALVIRALGHRLGALEDQLSPATYLTDTQAAEVAAAVKGLAQLLTAQDASKNQYQGVFAELYRRFRVSSYKQLRQDQFQAVLAFLADWSQAVEGAGPALPA